MDLEIVQPSKSYITVNETPMNKKQNIFGKVIGKFGLTLEDKQIYSEKDIFEKKQKAQIGWNKVRNLLTEARQSRNAGYLYALRTKGTFCQISTFLIYPQSNIKAFLTIVQSAFILYQILMVPYRYAFIQVDNDQLIQFDIGMDVISLMIIFTHFFYVYIEKERYITNFKLIVTKYIIGIMQFDPEGFFLIDILTILPYYSMNQLYLLRFLRYLQVGLVFEGYTLLWRNIIRIFTSNINFNKSFTDILRFLLQLFIIAQCLACFWFYLGNQQDILEGYDYQSKQPVYLDGWVYNRLLKLDPQADSQTYYITSLYWVFTTLTTVGYGDYYGITTNEMLFTMSVEFLGVFVFAYMMGNINILAEKLDDDHMEYLQNENELFDEWFIKISRANQARRFSENFIDELRQRLNIYWQRDHSSLTKDYSYFKQIPFKLQQELANEVFGRFIATFSVFFKGLEQQFIQAVVISLAPKQFLVKQGDIEIIKADSHPEEIFFITKGKVAISTRAGQKYIILSQKSYFGEHLIMFNLKSSNIYQTMGEDVECMCIDRQRFLQLCQIYPKSKNILKYKAFVRRKFQFQNKLTREDKQKENQVEFNLTSQRQIRIQQKFTINQAIETDEEYDQEIQILGQQISSTLDNIQTQITIIDNEVKQKLTKIKTELDFITKYEEVLQEFELR